MSMLNWAVTYQGMKVRIAIFSLSYFLLLPAISFGQVMLFSEDFETTTLATKGWYDNTTQTFSSAEHITGSTQSLEFHWLPGAKTPTSGGAIRHAFSATTTLYVSYWVKYQNGYRGSGLRYHPHEFYILTNADGPFSGLAYNTLDFYIQHIVGDNGIVPQLEIQDGKMVDTSKIGTSLIGVTEARAVAGCNGNGNSGGMTVNGVFGGTDCYSVGGGTYWNSYMWNSKTVRLSMGSWHHIEVYAQMNSITGGIGQNDGIVRYWLDGNLIIDQSNVIMRTGANPSLAFNQLVLSPYIGAGSPIDQTFWIDDLTVATGRIGGGPLVPPVAPENLTVR